MVINILGSGYPTKSRNNQQSWLREQDLHYSTYEKRVVRQQIGL